MSEFKDDIEELRKCLSGVGLSIAVEILNDVAAELDRLTAALAEVREALRDVDYASLPNDFPEAEIAKIRMQTLHERTLEGMALIGKIEAITSENTRIRAALATSSGACVYCSLTAEEWAKCSAGFPGCARADDAMGCPELGARLELEQLKADLAEAEKKGWEKARHAICSWWQDTVKERNIRPGSIEEAITAKILMAVDDAAILAMEPKP